MVVCWLFAGCFVWVYCGCDFLARLLVSGYVAWADRGLHRVCVFGFRVGFCVAFWVDLVVWCLFRLALLFRVALHVHSVLAAFVVMLICLFMFVFVVVVRFINSVGNTFFYIFARRCAGFWCLFV